MEMEVGDEKDAGRKRQRGSLGESEAGEPSNKGDPVLEFWLRKIHEEDEREEAKYTDEDWSDVLGVEARLYREGWESYQVFHYGPFDRITRIPSMRYTDEPVPSHASANYNTLQFFSVKIREIRDCLQWPLHVFGVVAARDTIDQNRNVIFNRERHDCQILTEQDPYLVLTGPTRAVVECTPVYFEVALKVKGSSESEDKELSYLTVALTGSLESSYTRLINKEYTSRLSTLELTFGYIVRSVEATVNVQVTDGSWPVGFYGRFTAHTASLEGYEMLLFDSGNEKVPVDGDGVIKLSRRVASVELEGELKVSVVAFRCENDDIVVVAEDDEHFRPKRAGKSFGKLDVGFCKMEVTVFWSLISLLPGDYS